MRRILVAAGDPGRVDFRGGQPHYFYAAALAADFIHEALPLRPERLLWQRRLWNLGSALAHGTPFGFQYSRSFRTRLFAPYRDRSPGAEYISYFPLLPPEPWPERCKTSYYVDATLQQNFDDYGLGARISRRLRAQALDQERRNYQAAERIVCRSSWAAASVIRDYGIPPDKVHVILPGASLDEPVADQEPERSPPALEPLRLGLVGRDWQRKGLTYLLRVSDALRARGYAVEVSVVGPDSDALPRHPSLRALGYLSKAGGTARFAREIRTWHFGCLFSQAEALSSFLRECLRLGVPVLASRVGGIPDAVPPGLGFLFPPEAPPDQVADLLIGLVDTPEGYAELRSRVAARAAEFSWGKTVEKFVALWRGSDAFAYGRLGEAHGQPH